MFSQGEDGESDTEVTSVIDDDDTDIPFVGREARREEIKSKITQRKDRRRLIQICGPPMVGKSRIAKQVMYELRREARDKGFTNFISSMISVRGLNNLESIKLQLSVIFNLLTATPHNFIKSLERHLLENDTMTYLLVFDNCEAMFDNTDLLDEFKMLVEQLIHASNNITIMMTSIRILVFMHLDERKTWVIENLEPLNETEAEKLMLQVTSNVHNMNTETCKTICNLCYRYPYMIIFVGRILNAREYEPEEVVTVLRRQMFGGLEHDAHSKTDRPSVALYNQLSPLSDMLKKSSLRFAYFPQSFDVQAAAYVGGFTDALDAKSGALHPLKDRTILEFNHENRRYMMHSVYRDFLHKTEVVDITEIRETRVLFAHWFGEMLININGKLDKKHPQVVLRDMMEDWPNIEHLLQEAVHCSDSGAYEIYMQVARKADQFIGKYMPQNGITFFRSLLAFAQKCGILQDIPVLLSNLGNTMSNSTRKQVLHFTPTTSHMLWLIIEILQSDKELGSVLEDISQCHSQIGEILYSTLSKTKSTNIGGEESIKPMKKAYRMMMESGQSTYHLRQLIANMAWVYFRMGKTQKAYSLQKQALNMIVDDPKVGEDKRNQNLTLKLMNHLALSYTSHSEFDKSNMILGSALEKARKTSPFHPVINAMTNTMGLNNDGLHATPEGGLQNYQESLHQRRQFEDMTSLVIPLNNVAKCLMREHRYAECLTYLYEAHQIQEDQGKSGSATIVTKRQIGSCLVKVGKTESALEYFTQALDLLSKFYPKHYDIPEVKIEMASCYKELGRVQEVVDVCVDLMSTCTTHYLNKSSTVHISLKTALKYLNECMEPSPQKESYQKKFENKFRELAKAYREDDNDTRAIEMEKSAQTCQKERIDAMNAQLKLLSLNPRIRRVSFNMEPTCYSRSESFTSDSDNLTTE